MNFCQKAGSTFQVHFKNRFRRFPIDGQTTVKRYLRKEKCENPLSLPVAVYWPTWSYREVSFHVNELIWRPRRARQMAEIYFTCFVSLRRIYSGRLRKKKESSPFLSRSKVPLFNQTWWGSTIQTRTFSFTQKVLRKRNFQCAELGPKIEEQKSSFVLPSRKNTTTTERFVLVPYNKFSHSSLKITDSIKRG